MFKQMKTNFWLAPKMWITLGTVFYIAFLGFVAKANANANWTEDFESCSGTYTCTDWSAYTSAQTYNFDSTEQVHGGTYSLKTDNTTGTVSRQFNPESDDSNPIAEDTDIFSVWIYKSSGGSGVGDRSDIYLHDSSYNSVCIVSLYDNNVYGGGSGGTDYGDYSDDTWFQLEIMPVSSGTAECQLRVDGGSWSSAFDSGGTGSSATRFRMQTFSTNPVYFDDISVGIDDPRNNPVSTVDSIDDFYYNQAYLSIPHVETNVDMTTYPSETVTFDARIYLDATGGSPVIQALYTGMPQNASCLSGDYCADLVQIANYPFVAGTDYEITVRACFDGYSCGEWSSAVQFDTLTGIGGSTDGVWDGTGLDSDEIDEISSIWGGGYTDWNDFITSYPSHDTVMGACSTTANPATWIACAWSYVIYGLAPDADSFGNVISTPLGVLLTRWPITYLTVPVDSFKNGLYNSSNTCGIPDILGDTILGTTIDSFSLCDSFDEIDVAGIVESNSTMETIYIACVWFFFAMLWFRMARNFFHA